MTRSPSESILNLLKAESMSVNEICQELFQKEGVSERTVKTTIFILRLEGKIKPNRQWKIGLAQNNI